MDCCIAPRGRSTGARLYATHPNYPDRLLAIQLKGEPAVDELINLVSQKTGLPQDKARAAAETVIGFIKDRLPAPIASQIDTLLAGGGMPKDLAKGLGGILGQGG